MEEYFYQEKGKTGQVKEINSGRSFFNKFLPLGKNEEKMKQEGRKDKKGYSIEPVKHTVESIHFSCGGKDIERIEGQGKNIEIDKGHREGLLRIQENNDSYD